MLIVAPYFLNLPLAKILIESGARRAKISEAKGKDFASKLKTIESTIPLLPSKALVDKMR